jgi:Ca2+:H+ antiporter
MNKQHPFGLPLWKPALYKKSRSVVRKANSALHSSPSSSSELFLNPGNILWSVLFGWWLALVIFLVSLPISVIPSNGRLYGIVLRELSFYILWPFGRYVERLVDISPSTVSDLEHEYPQPSPVLIDDNDEYEEERGLLDNTVHHNKRKKYSWSRHFKETIRLGPAGWIYYLALYLIIGKKKKLLFLGRFMNLKFLVVFYTLSTIINACLNHLLDVRGYCSYGQA